MLLERILKQEIAVLVVAHKDRLVRFGFELITWLCETNSCNLIVLNDQQLSPAEQMVEDILAILNCFSSHLYGLRKYKSQIEKEDVQSLSNETKAK